MTTYKPCLPSRWEGMSPPVARFHSMFFWISSPFLQPLCPLAASLWYTGGYQAALAASFTRSRR